MDLGAVLLELRIAALHLLDDDVCESREVRRLEADAVRVLRGAPDDPAHDVPAPFV